MSRVVIAALATTAAFWAGSVLAQQPAGPPVGPDFSKVEVQTTDLGNRTYMLVGFGGNSTIAVATMASSWSMASSRRCTTS
jgi:hypothetical protein